jgi:oligopeptide/dipeptide ABC transporter ATP-binding protein
MTVPETPLIRVDDLKKYYPIPGKLPFSPIRGWIRALDGISFQIPAGETLGLVGETGCGKTTTSKLVLMLEEPTSGAIYFEGRNVQTLRGQELKRYRSDVQAVFQNPLSSLDPRMKVGDIVAEPLVVQTKNSRLEREERVAQLLAEVGLDPAVANNLPHEFSGGQRQRIAVARALSLNSPLIVLDEPVSALDVSIRAQIMNLLKDLQDQHGMSYLLIAHNLAAVRYLSHQVAVMYLGKIVEQASSERLFSYPRHPYTQALISASVMAPPEGQKEIILRGEVPSPANPPSGCHFHPRCPLRERLGNPERCEEEEPRPRELGPGHIVACHFPEESMGERDEQNVKPRRFDRLRCAT